MKIGKRLSDEEWESRIIPVVTRLFQNPDRAIRVCLLDNLPNIIDHLSEKLVNDKVFPQMATGFTDVAPLVREQTVKAVLTIVVKLSDRTVNGELLKHLAKTSNDEQPGIRTNTTICLGKIARNLSPNMRQKVLVAAFARSLRDPFVHARNAALLALAATSDLFNDDDCAVKILPALCPSLVDKEKLVRDQANKCFDMYLQRIRRYGNSLPDTTLPPPNAVSANTALPRISTSQIDSVGWAGWTISSFTNKLGTASGDIQSKSSTLRPSASERSASMPPATEISRFHSSTASASSMHRQAMTGTSTPAQISTPPEQTYETATEGDDDFDQNWGELADDDFFDNSQSNQSNALPITYDDGDQPDFEGWLNAQAQAKSKAPLPKGLAKPSAPAMIRTTTTGSVGFGPGTKKLASVAPKLNVTATKPITTKPKDSDDDWGDAWD